MPSRPSAIEVRKIPLHSVSDASELTKLIDDGVIHADRVIAVIGKTEGNGGVNDYTRIIADRAFREALVAKGAPADQVAEIPIVWSGGTDGVISPHATVFATVPDDGRRTVRRAAAHGRLRDERRPAAGGHRSRRDDHEGRGRGGGGDGAGRDHRPRRRPLRADQDAAADHRHDQRREGGQRVRWYVMSSTNDFDVHAPHWHGNTVLVGGMRTDVLTLTFMGMSVANMVPDNVGTWLFHCHVSFTRRTAAR